MNRGVEGTIKHAKGVKVAVFSGGFESVKPETKDTLLITSADQLMNYAKSEELATEKVCINNFILFLQLFSLLKKLFYRLLKKLKVLEQKL